MTSEFWRSYAGFVVRRPRVVVCASLIATAIIASGVHRLVVEVDQEMSLPADHPYIAIDRKIRAEFGGQNFVAIALVPTAPTIWRHDVLQAVYDLTLDLLRSPGVMAQNVVSLSSPYVRVPRDRDGVLTIDYLMKDVPNTEADVAALRILYNSEPLFKGALVSADERAALVLVDFFDGVSVEQIAATIERAVAKYRSPQMRIAVTGAPIFDNYQEVLSRQQSAYFLGTIAAIVCVLFLAFAQIQGVVLPLATALLSTLWALGFMGFAGISMNPWTAAVPIVVVTIAAGHSAQMLKRYYEEFRRLGSRDDAVVESATRMGTVMMAAGGTAACGFAALSILRIPTLTQFGFGVACGIAAAVVLEMSFMLALRAVWPTGTATSADGPLARALAVVMHSLAAVVSRHPRRIAACFAAVALLAVAGLPRLTTEFAPRAFWPARSEVGQDLRIFDAHFPSTITLTVLLDGEPGAMKTPEAVGLMNGLQQAMTEDPAVGRTASLADIIRRTYEVFAPEEAARGLPADDAGLIAQLFYLSESPATRGYVDLEYRRAVVRGFLNRDDSASTRQVIHRLERYVADHPPRQIHVWIAGGVGPVTVAINDQTVSGKILNIAMLLATMFMLASLLFRSPLGGLYVVAPVAMALVVNVGLFAWLRIAFDISGASIVAIGAGIGADYAIYYLYRLREEFHSSGDIETALRSALETSGSAVAFVALAISAGFAVYVVSDYYPLRICGIFIPITMLVSCLTTLTLLPALLLEWRPGFVFRSWNSRASATEAA